MKTTEISPSHPSIAGPVLLMVITGFCLLFGWTAYTGYQRKQADEAQMAELHRAAEESSAAADAARLDYEQYKERKARFAPQREADMARLDLDRKAVQEQYWADRGRLGDSLPLQEARDRQLDRIEAKREKVEAEYQATIHRKIP